MKPFCTDSSPRASGPSSGDDWKNAFDAAANGSDPYSDSRVNGHNRRYSDEGSNSSSRRTPTRLPPAPPGSYRY